MLHIHCIYADVKHFQIPFVINNVFWILNLEYTHRNGNKIIGQIEKLNLMVRDAVCLGNRFCQDFIVIFAML